MFNIFFHFVMFIESLFQFCKSIIGMILYKNSSPLKNIISKNKAKQIDDVFINCFSTSFDGFLERLDVSIKICILDKSQMFPCWGSYWCNKLWIPR
jgi:hypothetical protein